MWALQRFDIAHIRTERETLIKEEEQRAVQTKLDSFFIPFKNKNKVWVFYR
jgi:hypothetical protein